MKEIPIKKIDSSDNPSLTNAGFRIRVLHHVLDGKDMVQRLHRHDFYFILVLKKGRGNHTIDFTSYPVKDDSVFILRPGQVHELELKKGCSGYLIEFKSDFFSTRPNESVQLLRKLANTNYCHVGGQAFKKLFSLLTYVFQEYDSKQEGYLEVIKSNLNIFFIELQRHRKNRKDSSRKSNAFAQERLDQLFELLEAHITSHKQAAEYADMLNLSPYQLNAITKTTLGKTCSELIDEQIVLESKRYLLATSKQVNQIAYQLGYEDASYFIRFFKKKTGYTPENFRNNFR